jgi:hypothetical protein
LTPRKLATSLAVAVLSASALALGGGFASAATTGATTAGAASAAPASPAALAVLAALAAPWKTAREVPGLASLSKGDAGVNAVSCATAVDCVVGGSYTDAARKGQAFVAAEANGTWGNAIQVPGSAGLNKGGFADVLAVSCKLAKECTIAGTYTDAGHHVQLFAADEKNGHWGAARQVPGSARLNTGGTAFVAALACGTPHGCAVAGLYTTGPSDNVTEHALVANEKNGIWGNAIQVPGLSALKATHGSQASSVSCTAGSCAVTGFYLDAHFGSHAFVADQKNGSWGNARVVPGVGVNSDGTGISCAGAGCAVTGDFADSRGNGQVYVAVEAGGVWRKAIAIPGSTALNNGGEANAVAVSCASADGCVAVGSLVHVAAGKSTTATYAAEEIGGTWHAARLISAPIAKPGVQAFPSAVSCVLGSCAVGGISTDAQGHSQAFTVNEAGGTWGNATPVPGLATLNKGQSAAIMGIACAVANKCAAGGFYTDAHARGHAFVTTG